MISCYGLALESLVEIEGLFACYALRITVEVHPLHYLLVLLLQVPCQELSDDGLHLALDPVDNHIPDLEHPPDEPSVHLLPLCESLCHCVQSNLFAVPVGLTAL